MANAAWTVVMAEAAAAAAEEDRRKGVLALVDEIADQDEPDLTPFAIERADYENLMFIMDELRRRARRPGISALIRELSAEFFRRRTQKRKRTP